MKNTLMHGYLLVVILAMLSTVMCDVSVVSFL